jgi:hypothetical protein
MLGDASVADAFVGCATTTQKATAVPLDLYFMLDTSGSMDDLVAAGQSKWSAVVAAMTAFVQDPASAGIGMGLQYFPLVAAGVPASCTSDAQCGSAAPCAQNLCTNINQTVFCSSNADCPNTGACSNLNQPVFCASNGDCPRGSQCIPSTCVTVGECQYDHNFLCPNPGSGQCGPDPNGFPLGACEVMPSSTCVFGDSCAAQDYQTPAVAIAALPGVAATVMASLAAHHPQGNTPTSAALQGAIDEAASYAGTHPGHAVVAVLATDGIPDECVPTVAGVAQIAAAGFAGRPSIKTFAIGVFTPSDAPSGTAALNQIAASGGTRTAFIVNSSQNVEQQFSAALNAIRGAALPCSYQVPSPDGGTPDFGKLNVQYTAGSGSVSTIPYVENPGRCNPTTGGWYYNADPAEGGVPSQIVVCPATCSTFGSDTKGRVDVVLGCQTVLM